MTNRSFARMFPALLAAVLALHFSVTHAGAQGQDCEAAGNYAFVCGPENAEDLVRVPDTHWILASSMTPGGGINLVDAEQKTWRQVFPGPEAEIRHDVETYSTCPGAPDPDTLATHGLNLRGDRAGHSALYVVSHGEREAIEVFGVDTNGDRLLLTWRGCIPTPEGMAANSVASLPDGSLLITIPLRAGISISEAFGGKPTGAVYAWSPGNTGFSAVVGTELPYPNGIEASPDGRVFYVASSGLFNVTAFSNTNPARVLRRSEALGFLPDNVHLDAQGRLLTAGLRLDDPVCGNLEQADAFDFDAFMTCPRAFTVWAMNPESLEGRSLATGPANADFSNITTALPVDDELWIGTFHGDRIAYRSPGKMP